MLTSFLNPRAMLMPASVSSCLKQFTDLIPVLSSTEGFPSALGALRKNHSITIDGAWGSSASLSAAWLGQNSVSTLLVALAHPRDVDPWVMDIKSFSGIRPVVLPAWDHFSLNNTEVDEIAGQRLRLLKALEQENPPRVIVTTIRALMQPVPDRTQLTANRRALSVGEELDMEEISEWLLSHGYRHVEVVELPGEMARRGGILDVFSPDAENPCRLELFGDEIESMRWFDPGTQRSQGPTEKVEITGTETSVSKETDTDSLPLTGHFCDYLPENAWTVLVELEELKEQGTHYLDRTSDLRGLFSVEAALQHLTRFPSARIAAFPAPSSETTCHLQVESVERFSGKVTKVRDELDTIATHDQVLIACQNEGEQKRLGEVLASSQLAQSERLHLFIGHVQSGFRLVDAGLVVLGGQELFHREEAREVMPRRRQESRAIDSFLDLTEGDLVVHVSHGIARYRGMKVIEKNDRHEEHLILEFRDRVLLYVPASKIELVQKYVGGSKSNPDLSKLGGVAWSRKKEKAQEAVFDLASDMLQMQAIRDSQPGIATGADSEWQGEFEASFPYQETPDQLTTISEVKQDLQQSRPMDRLICGDVGYGKTEIAIRAAFKMVDNGRQVAVLVPTTVLAEQHFRTFTQRLAEYPFVIECLNRFRKGKQQREIVKGLAEGNVDIVIGTHRLVSKDVSFHDLGLVIIDEEQRFGVDHKERLKSLRAKVDVLTMTATPIPRTLHLSLLGIRDISNLETPPPDRLAIETRIMRYDPSLIRHAILRELNREGQVYFVHNRVNNIHEVTAELKSIVPEASFDIVHGQMTESELEPAMMRFVNREADVLVATTIIESGLDIPNANTIFINQAEHYGLADLHQLRGRVGRYKHRAYAYLLLNPNKMLSPTAARRLKAIEEFTDLGAGFQIALRDLEIRGAGNILGTQQSGHIAAVGYELYCQLLEKAVKLMKNEPVQEPIEINLDLPWTAWLPRDYVQAHRSRIEVYRRLSRIPNIRSLEDFHQEMRDRFGPLPDLAEWLFRETEIRILASHWHIVSIHLEEGAEAATDVVLTYRTSKRIKRLVNRTSEPLKVVDEKSAYLRIGPKDTEPLRLYERLRSLLGVS